MTSPFLVFAAPDIQDAAIAGVEACLRSGGLGTGQRVARFEADFAACEGLESGQVAGVNPCKAALNVSLVGAGLEPASEVMATTPTFCATVNAILHAGPPPALVDVAPRCRTSTPTASKPQSRRARAILPVHFAGRACDMDRIMAIARDHGLLVIED